MISNLFKEPDFYEEIYRSMGYKGNKNVSLQPMIDEMIALVNQHCEIRKYFEILEQEITIIDDKIIGENFTFVSGKIINHQLQGINRIVLFTVTLGNSFDDKLTELFAKGETIKAYIFDTIGSVLVEKIADFLEVELANQISEDHMGHTNRFSPGYCGWDVKEQQILFGLLPEKCCGINLNSSSLMKPVKSISGIIGIGEGVIKKDYACSLCNMKDCYKRRR